LIIDYDGKQKLRPDLQNYGSRGVSIARDVMLRKEALQNDCNRKRLKDAIAMLLVSAVFSLLLLVRFALNKYQ